MSMFKQTKLTRYMAPMFFQTYKKEPKLYVESHLIEHLKRIKIKSYRDTDKLFLTCMKPYRAASMDIISRWRKSINTENAITIQNYTSYSARVVASSYVKSREASLSTII